MCRQRDKPSEVPQFRECAVSVPGVLNQAGIHLHGVHYGTVELVFKITEDVRNVTIETIEDKKWLLFPNYSRTFHVGAR